MSLSLPKANKLILLQETFFERWGRGGGGDMQERFSDVSNNRFFKRGHFHKTLLVRTNFISNINSGQTSYLDFDKFGIGNKIQGSSESPHTLTR